MGQLQHNIGREGGGGGGGGEGGGGGGWGGGRRIGGEREDMRVSTVILQFFQDVHHSLSHPSITPAPHAVIHV